MADDILTGATPYEWNCYMGAIGLIEVLSSEYAPELRWVKTDDNTIRPQIRLGSDIDYIREAERILGKYDRGWPFYCDRDEPPEDETKLWGEFIDKTFPVNRITAFGENDILEELYSIFYRRKDERRLELLGSWFQPDDENGHRISFWRNGDKQICNATRNIDSYDLEDALFSDIFTDVTGNSSKPSMSYRYASTSMRRSSYMPHDPSKDSRSVDLYSCKGMNRLLFEGTRVFPVDNDSDWLVRGCQYDYSGLWWYGTKRFRYPVWDEWLGKRGIRHLIAEQRSDAKWFEIASISTSDPDSSSYYRSATKGQPVSS